MAGNDKPNLSDLKARLSFRLGEQNAVQAPAPTPQSGGHAQSPQASSNQQWSQQGQQGQQGMWNDPAYNQDPAYQQQAQQQAYYQQQQVAAQQQAYQQQQAAQQAAAQQQAAVHQQTGQAAQQAAHHQQAGQAQAAAQQALRQQQVTGGVGRSAQPGGVSPNNAAKKKEGGGLKDLQASFQESNFKPIQNDSHEFKGNPILTPAGIIIAIALFAIGSIGAFMFAKGSNKRQIFNYQISDAREGFEALDPKVKKFNEMRDSLEKMEAKEIDFSAVEALNNFEFVVDGSPFNTNRVLLGAKIISPMIRYLTDSSAIKAMIAEHVRLTMADKEELEAIIGGGSPLGQYDQFGVIFNYDQACRDGEKPNYAPSAGEFVAFTSLAPDSEGKYNAIILNSGKPRPVAPRFIIPIRRKDVVGAQGRGNALETYTKRLEALKRRVNAVDYTGTMLDALQEKASAQPPGLFSF